MSQVRWLSSSGPSPSFASISTMKWARSARAFSTYSSGVFGWFACAPRHTRYTTVRSCRHGRNKRDVEIAPGSNTDRQDAIPK